MTTPGQRDPMLAGRGNLGGIMDDTHICPECVQGKHRNCDGIAWCLIEDCPVRCTCEHV